MYARLQLTDKCDKELNAEIKEERNCKFRLAVLEDVDKIMLVVAQAQKFLREQGVDQWQNGYPTPEVFRDDIERGECWVALKGEEIAGVLTLTLKPEPAYTVIEDGAWLTAGEKSGVIHRSAVSSQFRGSGLADGLFELAERTCREMGMESVRIDTHQDNRVMRKLLNRRGFQPCGIVKVDVGTEHDPKRIGYEKLL